MTDRDALLRAVLERPGDDTPRLVYADWLDERGEHDRAELIRVGCELARLDDDEPWLAAAQRWVETNHRDLHDPDVWADSWPELSRRMSLAARHARLSRKCVRAERVNAPKLPGRWRWPGLFRRGFLDHVVVPTGEALAAHAGAIWSFAPVSRVRARNLTAAGAEAIVRAGLLPRLGEVSWYSDDPEALRVFGSSPDAAAVRSLLIGGHRGAEAVRALAEHPRWSGLRTLSLPDRLNAATVAAVFEARHLRSLAVLDLFRAELSPESLARLAGGSFPNLQVLRLDWAGVGDAGAAALAEGRGLRNLRVLLVRGGEVSARGADALARSPNLPRLTLLDLSHNALGSPAVPRGGRPSRRPGLRVLDLRQTSPSAAAFAALLGSPSLTGLAVFVAPSFYSSARYGARGWAAALAAAGGWDRLTVLDLYGAKLSPETAAALAKWPGLRTVRMLDLRENPIGEAGAKAIAASPHLTMLRRLLVRDLDAGEAGVAALRARFGRRVRPC